MYASLNCFLKVDGIDPNYVALERYYPALIHAVKEGYTAIVELLLAAVDINPNVRRYNKTPLHWPARWDTYLS